MPYVREKWGQTSSPTTPACMNDDPNCDLTRYLVVLVIVLVVIALFMCICRQFMRLVVGKRNRNNPTQTDTDVIYPRDDRHAQRAHQNFGFMDPPPRYEQIFKRGGGTPAVITTREAPSVTRSSGDVGLPPSYEQAAIARREQALSLSQSTIREVPLSSVDMEHPTMPSPSSTVLDMESEIANIQTHAQACVHRYDSNHADEVARTAASVSAPSSSSTLPELEAPAGGPPGYDAISLHNETVQA